MARLLQCDKCGASFDLDNSKEVKGFKGLRFDGRDGSLGPIYDVCGPCFDSIVAFIGFNVKKEK